MKESLKGRLESLCREVSAVADILDNNDEAEVGRLIDDDADVLYRLGEDAYRLSLHAVQLYEVI